MQKSLIVLLAFTLSVQTFASDVEVEVPQDELARESVYPVYDNPNSVRNRNVATQGRIDIGVFGGLALTEPIASTTKIGLAANYHLNEYHSLGGFVVMNNSGLSKDAEGLKNDFGLDFSRAPKPQSTLMVDYNYKPYYGKMSFTKDGVINTTIYGSAAAGIVKYEHKSYPAIAIGIGERFYFGKSFSLKTDLRLFAHQAPIPFKANALKDGSQPPFIADAAPSFDSFDERVTYTTNLEIGVNYLF